MNHLLRDMYVRGDRVPCHVAERERSPLYGREGAVREEWGVRDHA